MGPLPVMFAGVMPTRGFARGDDAGAVRSDDAGDTVAVGVKLGLGDCPEFGGVLNRNAFSNDYNEADAGFDGFNHGVLGECRRNEDDGDVGAGFSDGFLDGAKDGDFLVAMQDRGAGLAGVDATNNVGAGLEHQCGVLGAFAAGDALNDDLGVFVEVDRHCRVPLLSCVGELGGLVGALVHGGGPG